MKSVKWFSFMLLFVMFSSFFYVPAFADEDEDEEGYEHEGYAKRERHREHKGREENELFSGSSSDPLYTQDCGACHFAYPPELLPSDSWQKILSDLQDHHGNEMVIERQVKEKILQYLEANSAGKSRSERARKIVRSLGGETPTRITEIPYIRHKHHEIPPEVFQRKSIGSFSNCVACHKGAQQGAFDEDSVVIPD